MSKEKLLQGETGATINGFTFEEQRFNLPLDAKDVDSFSDAIQAYNPPKGWLKRVLSSMQYIDNQTFEKDLDNLARITKKELKDKPYIWLSSRPNKSDYWIYKKLLEKGLSPSLTVDFDTLARMRREAVEKLVDRSFDPVREKEKMRRFKNTFLKERKKIIPLGYPICFFDDFAISGMNIGRTALGEFQDFSHPSDEYKAFVCYATDIALNSLSRREIYACQSGQKIHPLSSFLTTKDITFLEELHKELTQGSISDERVPFWTWYKIPDNIPKIFTGSKLPPLIRTERFQPPYKKPISNL